MSDMWAAQLVAPSTFADVRVPVPTAPALAPGEVLLRVRAGAICGSDMPLFKGAIQRSGGLGNHPDGALPGPGCPMHEVVGDVLASRHPDFEAGTTAVGWALGQDAIAELVVTEGDSLVPDDGSLPPASAVVAQPLACVIYAVERMGDVSGQRVAVLGQGPIGMLFSHVLKSMGRADHVVGVDRVDRSAEARVFGVDEFVRASCDRWVESLAADDRPQVVVESIGHQVGTLTCAVDAVADGGLVYYFGVPDDLVYPVPMHTFFRKDLTLRAGTTKDRRRVLRLAQQYLREHPSILDAYVTHRLPMARVQDAYELAAAPRAGQLKVVLES
ncbi:zinc-binding dehydrogenase [Dactylosporangium fulvum]|uniref:Zinc-binding dehydrogenase n=1 Tax=Dactylosporangium fulvum TaxID=53359 RepID=A0ABY5VRN6_9ACTN|nr:zinc-binding dehydrogenase [Dactylosporangium fulvum]UWP79857.1 zinc-binding dehydrogenase [Dactylosporangium fulvum]